MLNSVTFKNSSFVVIVFFLFSLYEKLYLSNHIFWMRVINFNVFWTELLVELWITIPKRFSKRIPRGLGKYIFILLKQAWAQRLFKRIMQNIARLRELMWKNFTSCTYRRITNNFYQFYSQNKVKMCIIMQWEKKTLWTSIDINNKQNKLKQRVLNYIKKA